MMSEWPARMDVAATYDALGRKQPQRLGFMQFARAIPGYAAQFAKRVPDQFVAQVDLGVLEVACPCGVTPGPCCAWMVPTPCECDRIYVNLGSAVLVGYCPPQALDSDG